MNKEQITERTIRSLAKHPYLWLLGLCLLIDPFFFGSVGNIPNNALMLECFGLFGAAVIFSFRRYDRGELSKPRLCVFMICILSAVLLGAISYTNSQNKAIWHFFGGCILMFTMYYFTYMKKFRGQLNSVLIIGLGFMIKLHYILVTSVYTRQHDVFSFDSTAGHAGYIEYLLQNHHLSDFDPRDRWQFVHPPLHHVISALWIYLNENKDGQELVDAVTAEHTLIGKLTASGMTYDQISELADDSSADKYGKQISFTESNNSYSE